MKYSTQDLLLADAVRRIAQQLKGADAAKKIPFQAETLSSEISAKRAEWEKAQSDTEYLIRALTTLEEVAAIFNPST